MTCCFKGLYLKLKLLSRTKLLQITQTLRAYQLHDLAQLVSFCLFCLCFSCYLDAIFNRSMFSCSGVLKLSTPSLCFMNFITFSMSTPGNSGRTASLPPCRHSLIKWTPQGPKSLILRHTLREAPSLVLCLEIILWSVAMIQSQSFFLLIMYLQCHTTSQMSTLL
mgnify:FL=1